MGVGVCRVGPACFQNAGRLARPVYVCAVYGALAPALFSVRRKAAPAPFAEPGCGGVRGGVRPVRLFARLSSLFGIGRLRRGRLCRRHHVAGHLFARLRRPPQGRNGAVRPAGAGGRRRLCRGSHRRGRRIGRLRGRHPPGHRLRPRRAAADARCPLFLPRTRKGGAEAAAGQPVSRAVCFFRLAARAPRCIFFAMPPAAVRGRGTRHPSVRIE